MLTIGKLVKINSCYFTRNEQNKINEILLRGEEMRHFY